MNDDPNKIMDDSKDNPRNISSSNPSVEVDDFHTSNPSISSYGEQSISGTSPDPSSDDDTLKNVHEMGMQKDEDTEHPQPLDLGGDIDKAEEEVREG